MVLSCAAPGQRVFDGREPGKQDRRGAHWVLGLHTALAPLTLLTRLALSAVQKSRNNGADAPLPPSFGDRPPAILMQRPCARLAASSPGTAVAARKHTVVVDDELTSKGKRTWHGVWWWPHRIGAADVDATPRFGLLLTRRATAPSIVNHRSPTHRAEWHGDISDDGVTIVTCKHTNKQEAANTCTGTQTKLGEATFQSRRVSRRVLLGWKSTSLGAPDNSSLSHFRRYRPPGRSSTTGMSYFSSVAGVGKRYSAKRRNF